MISQTIFTGYFIGVYVWFVIGVLMIAIPAIKEIAKMLKKD
jgi:hypothetical protein